jgi:hypothetical protein
MATHKVNGQLQVTQTATFDSHVQANSLIVNGGSRINDVQFSAYTIDFPSISGNSNASVTQTFTGVVVANNNFSSLELPLAIDDGIVGSAHVSADDVIKIDLHNTTSQTIDPASGVYKVMVMTFA